MENQELTVADLVFVKSIIEIVSKRGAFNADELTAVGAFYDKLAGFLGGVQAQAEAAQASAAEAEAEAEQPQQGE